MVEQVDTRMDKQADKEDRRMGGEIDGYRYR
jgi:hypothetical protein